jgi:hypothetical protein
VAVISVNRTVNGVFQSADSTTLSIRNAAGTVVQATIPIAPVATGQYSYTSPALAAGNYSAIWTFNVAGYAPDVLVRPFTVDAPIEVSEGVRLMDIERAVARQCGTFRRVRAGAGGTTTTFFANRLKSSQNLGSFEAEFVLRRGLFWDNTLVTNFSDDDRVRGISSYTSTSGTLGVDNQYALPIQVDESVEIMYLDPEEELRVAVLDGLARCFFWDTITLSPGLTYGADINVTALAPWLTNPQWIKGMRYSLSGSTLMQPGRVSWWEPYRSGKNVMLRSVGTWPGTIELQVLRPHISFVNGETSYAGPNSDLDVLYLDREYAVAAGVIEVWRQFPERISPIATQDMRIARKDAASEFTKKSMMISGQVPDHIQFDYSRRLDITQIGNLPEVVS